MTLSELLQDVKVKDKFTDVVIKDVTDSTACITPGCVFVCIRGERTDGSVFARQALAMGAVCVVCERELGLEKQVIVADARRAYAQMCAALFGNPSRRLRLFGVTGTNGKTTTTYLLKEIFERAGARVGLIGTIEDIVAGRSFDAVRTTPNPHELHRLFSQMVKSGCDSCVMEVSSQALAQSRVFGCQFETGVFTNLTRDHLDYHKTMQNYLEAKKILFTRCKTGVINLDDPFAENIINASPCRTVTYAVGRKADYNAADIVFGADQTSYRLQTPFGEQPIKMCLPGRFSVYNSLAAAAAASQAGVCLQDIAAALEKSGGVKGRMEFVPTGRGFSVIIDYAHTPDGLENVLSAINSLKKGRVITVFGCGGDRDKTKRPLMGEVAARLSDYSVITSDNPRCESPSEIIADILPAFKNVSPEKFRIVENRREAIEAALNLAGRDDIVLLAGKGHECYQVLGDGVIHFDEREIVKEFLGI